VRERLRNFTATTITIPPLSPFTVFLEQIFLWGYCNRFYFLYNPTSGIDDVFYIFFVGGLVREICELVLFVYFTVLHNVCYLCRIQNLT
jgi:hypothetical protein